MFLARHRDTAAGVNRTGIDLTPRIQFDRILTTGPANSRSGSRRRISSKATRASRRESDAPRQFFEEHEVRVVAIPMRADVLDKMRPADREAKPQKPILACSRAGIAVPYLEMFRDLPGIGCRGRLSIKRIIIGPHADAASRCDAIERLLVANGYDAQVSSSEIPYLGR